MADTITDVTLNPNDYVDIYTLSSIVVGTEIVIQNKGLSNILIQEAAVKPSATSSNGVIVKPCGSVLVENGSTGAWAKGSGTVNVQI